MYNGFIGVDLHKHQFTCYFLSKKGTGFNEKFSTNEKGINLFIRYLEESKKLGFKLIVAVESTGNTRYFKNRIEAAGFPVKVVNTMKFKVINESVNKTDKRDAKTIAEFLSKDMLPESKMCSERSEQLKRLVKSRKILVDSRVKLKNQVHGVLLGLGIESKNGQLNSKKGRKAIIEQVKDSINRKVIEIIITNIESLEENIKELEKQLEELTEEDRDVEILKSIPGTGSISAVTVRAHLDDIKRFSHFSKLSAYCGLVPWVQCSDKKEYYGSITKRGPVELRTAIIQMVLGMIRCKDEKDNRFMRQYRSLKKIKGSGKALVAIARKYTKLIWMLLSKDEEYNSAKLHEMEKPFYEKKLTEPVLLEISA